MGDGWELGNPAILCALEWFGAKIDSEAIMTFLRRLFVRFRCLVSSKTLREHDREQRRDSNIQFVGFTIEPVPRLKFIVASWAMIYDPATKTLEYDLSDRIQRRQYSLIHYQRLPDDCLLGQAIPCTDDFGHGDLPSQLEAVFGRAVVSL